MQRQGSILFLSLAVNTVLSIRKIIMGQLDEVSNEIGKLTAKVDILLDMGPVYETKISSVNHKLDSIDHHLASHDLPKMKDKIEKMERNRWIILGAASTAGAAGGGFLPWIKTLIAHILT